MNSVSQSRRDDMKRYTKAKREFVREFPNCALNPELKTRDVHHPFGRAGSLLLETRFWIPLSREMHNWIESHRKEAREIYIVKHGLVIPLLGPTGTWNDCERARKHVEELTKQHQDKTQ
jgi:hypothetical protein